MDRFIVFHNVKMLFMLQNLKSSMDRFIALSTMTKNVIKFNLKSSMDRFIENFSIKRAVPS